MVNFTANYCYFRRELYFLVDALRKSHSSGVRTRGIININLAEFTAKTALSAVIISQPGDEKILPIPLQIIAVIFGVSQILLLLFRQKKVAGATRVRFYYQQHYRRTVFNTK